MFENFPYDRKAYKLLKECSQKQDISEWNQYRKENNNAPINLRFANLSGFYLMGANLSFVDLRGSILSKVILNSADVKMADISFGLVFKFIVALISLMTMVVMLLYFGFDVPLNEAIAGVVGVIVFGVSFFGGVRVVDALFIIPSVASLHVSVKTTQKAIAKAKNPLECIGFDSKYLQQTDIDIVKQENQQLKEKLSEISDIEARKSIEERIAKNERNYTLLSEQQTAKASFELTTKNLIEEIQKPYKYLKTHIRIQYGLVALFLIVIMAILSLGLYYGDDFFALREGAFMKLLENKDTLPEFGTLFGAILFYGTPILLAIAMIIYLFAKINHSLDKITAYQSKEQKIMELIAIIKAKIALGLSADEFKGETTKMLNKLQSITFTEYSKIPNTQIDEPKMDYINNAIKEAQEKIKGESSSED